VVLLNDQVFIVDAVLMLQQPGSLLALWMTNRPRHHRFVHEKLFPAWGVVHVATWYWLKVTNAGDPVSPLHSLHRHPFEQLWLARVGVQQGIEQLTTGGQPESAGLQTPVTAVVTESLRPIIVAQASQCPADADVPDNPEQGEQLQGDCRQEPDTSVSNQCMPAAEAASGANISRATHPPDQHVVISVPGQHSRKPHLQQLLLSYVLVIDSEAPGTQPSQLQQPCIAELFARELFRGGMAWGNEVLKFQEISGNWKKMV
jgi:N6-adenosine-specific RNA methylase IME4